MLYQIQFFWSVRGQEEMLHRKKSFAKFAMLKVLNRTVYSVGNLEEYTHMLKINC